MSSSDARRSARRDAHKVMLGELEDDVIILVEDFGESDAPTNVKINVFGQLKQLLENVETAGWSDHSRLVSGPIAALGGATTDHVHDHDHDHGAPHGLDDGDVAKLEVLSRIFGGSTAKQVVDFFARLFGPLDGLSEEQRRARMAVIHDVANATMVVRDDGTLEIVEERDNAQRELRELHRKVDPLLNPLESLPDAQKRARMNGMKKVADGDTVVQADGTPAATAPAPTPDPRVAQLEGFLNEVKSHSRRSRMNNDDLVVDTTALSDEAKAAITS